MDGKLRFLSVPALLSRNTFGQGHVLFFLVDVQAKQFLLVAANIVSRKAFKNIAKRTKFVTLFFMRVEAPGDRIPRLTTRLNSGGQAVPVCSQGSTGNQQFSPKGSRVLFRMACRALAHARKATSLN